MSAKKPIVAIDGPAGSGKSTVAKLVAKKLNLFYIDTGAMYRCLALEARRRRIDVADGARLAQLASTLDLGMSYDAASQKLTVTLNGQDVSDEIRTPQVTRHVSDIAKIKEVRKHLVALQRRLADGKHAILEGRDTTTVVFPDAYKKFYLDADPGERVQRRYLEMREKQIPVGKDQIQHDIQNRDTLDSTREVSPLVRAEDAVYIDTTHLSIEEVVARVIDEINKP